MCVLSLNNFSDRGIEEPVMPCAYYTCEYCKEEFRRDALAPHVKSKHIKDHAIANKLLEEYKEYAGKPVNYSTLQRIMNQLDPSAIPIYSDLYENGRYYFGVKPNFFMDDEDKQAVDYKTQQNMDSHKETLREITDSITLTEMIEAGIQIIVRSPEVLALRKQLRETQSLLTTLQEETEKNEAYMTSLKQDIQDFKDMTDCNQTIAEMKKELQSTRHMYVRAQKEAHSWKETYENYREESMHEMDEHISHANQSRLSMEKEWIDSTEKCREMEQTLKKRIAEGVAKEMDKMRKDKEKEKEKAKKEKKKAKEKAKEAMMMAKLKAKLKKKADKGSSDSESDSDSSDSDASDSDDD